MARIGIAITKSCTFRDAVQEFSNVYYYENGGALPTAAQADALIDEVTALEKARHSTLVSFVRGRCWSQVGSPSANEMLAQKALTGNGSAVADADLDRERAYLFRWRAGSDSRGNPVYLRKWVHACGQYGSSSGVLSSGLRGNSSGFTQTIRDAMAAQEQALATLATGGGGWALVAKSGRQRTETNCTAHKYLEHHQMGDMWRG